MFLLVAVWSGVNIAGVPLRELNKDLGTEADVEKWGELHKEVIDSAYKVIKLKGYTSWAIGLCVAHLLKAIVTNAGSINAISTLVQVYFVLTSFN